MTGDLDINFNNIINVPAPIYSNSPTTKFYVDSNLNEYFKQDGSKVVQNDFDLDDNKIINLAKPTENNDAATKMYVDTQIASIPRESNYFTFEFAAVGNRSWRQSYQLTGFMFWTNDRDIKLTLLAHVFDTDNALSRISLYYKIIYWTKAKVKKTDTSISKLNIDEYVSITGRYLQTFGIFKSIELSDISCFTMEYKYDNPGGSIGNESILNCLIEYV